MEKVSNEYSMGVPGLIGSGGVEVWIFKGVKAGTIKLDFAYRRPWEKDVPPVQTKSFTVTVK